MPPPRTRTLLNGTWDIEPSDDVMPPSTWRHTVPVPALVDVATPAYHWKANTYHYYRTTFDVPDASSLAFLVVEQAMFGTDVWLNGEHAGGDIVCYTSQEYNVLRTLKAGARNELVVRVGRKQDLPPESAVGNDQERTEWIPGIWGDVYLLCCGNPRVKRVQVIPHIETATAEVRISIENHSQHDIHCTVSCVVLEKASGVSASPGDEQSLTIGPHTTTNFSSTQQIHHLHLWSPDDPFLYEVETTVISAGNVHDSVRTTFGMREFTIVGPDMYLNGKRIFLKGGNIAFHRFLSDADRGVLPWNPAWVKKLLIDIPKAHNFNFFRCHIGQMYNRWYDIADAHGMLLQNEWMFWTTTGSKHQIEKEFTRWMQDNWNHPSIIIWDPLNECSDDIVQHEIVPRLRELDPTRPWESVDFIEDHPYIYSLGPVLNAARFGFARSLEEIEVSSTPSVVNEFLWWWLDNANAPARLTREVAERWLGATFSLDDLVQHQSVLVQELVELFRRMRVDAIQPFVYLSNNAGPTANWFLGDIKDLRPKPVLRTLKNAFAPFGISIELWDRHFFVGEERPVRIFIFNDHTALKRGRLSYGIVDERGTWQSRESSELTVEGSGCRVLEVRLRFPGMPGTYSVTAELTDLEMPDDPAFSRKIAHVCPSPRISEEMKRTRVAIIDDALENASFLMSQGIAPVDGRHAQPGQCEVLVVGEGVLNAPDHAAVSTSVARFIAAGTTVIVLEPELGIEDERTVSLHTDLHLRIKRRTDLDRGGYDSYVFAEDHRHPLWDGIPPEHLKMFNGAYGGEVVSQHDVSLSVPHRVLARCGLHLSVLAAAETDVAGGGRIILSRIQTRGRLAGKEGHTTLFERRTDPVAQRLFLNLLAHAAGTRADKQLFKSSIPSEARQ